MAALDALPEASPAPGAAPGAVMTRDDFPYSLRAYATPAGDGESGAGGWSLFLYRATDPAERDWLRANGFTLKGRLWVRTAAETFEDG